MSKQVAVKQETGLATVDQLPEWMKKGGNRGSEEVTTNDITLPRLEIIQDLSPQRKKSEPEYIEGAEEGMVFNTVTKELLGDQVLVIPVYFQMQYIIWKDRKKGGGFGGAFPSEAEAIEARKALENPEDWAIVDTHVHYVLRLVEGSTMEDPILEEAVISMAKSKAKVSRNWNTLVKLAGGDRFSRMYVMSVVPEKNKNGDAYFNFKVASKGYVSKPMYDAAEMMYEAVRAGQRTVIHEEEKEVNPSAAEPTAVDSEENPFN